MIVGRKKMIVGKDEMTDVMKHFKIKRQKKRSRRPLWLRDVHTIIFYVI